MAHGEANRRRLVAIGVAAVAGALSIVPGAAAWVPIPEDPAGTFYGPRVGHQAATTPATATRELVTVIDKRGALLYRFKIGNRYSIPFE